MEGGPWNILWSVGDKTPKRLPFPEPPAAEQFAQTRDERHVETRSGMPDWLLRARERRRGASPDA